jgi:putative component of toxin-antitoxin plasmid stabilization module
MATRLLSGVTNGPPATKQIGQRLRHLPEGHLGDVSSVGAVRALER